MTVRSTLYFHPTHDREGSNDDPRGSRDHRDVTDLQVTPAHDGEAGQFNVDAFGHHYFDPAHDGKGADHHFGSLDLGLSEIELAAAHDGDGGGVPTGPPPTLGSRPTHDGNDPSPGAPAGRLRFGYRSGREVGNECIEVTLGAGDERVVDPLGEFVQRQPSDNDVLAEGRHRSIAVGVRHPVSYTHLRAHET